jgi:phosphoribosylanthranilate isomerase
MGFVFASSSRQVSLKLAAELLAEVPAGVERIAVFRRPDPALLFKVLELPIDTIQADASWFIETLIPEGFHLLPVVPDGSSLVSRIDSALHVVPIGRFSRLGDVLVDSSSGGGSGRVADWDRVSSCTDSREVVLAGGLRPVNVAEAIRRSGAVAVDVSSGVESRPGLKDPHKIIKFVEAVRSVKERK